MCNLPYTLTDEDNRPLPPAEAAKPLLGIIASDGRKADVAETIVGHWPFLSETFHIVATSGTFSAIRIELDRAGIASAPHLERLPEKTNGVLELTFRVVMGMCQVVVAFADLDDVSLARPYHRALSRMCVVRGATVLHNQFGVDTYVDRVRNRRERAPASLLNVVSEALRTRPELLRPHLKRGAGGGSLALVAHDARKTEMVAFVMRHRDKLRQIVDRGGRLLATGTTGGLVQRHTDVPVIRYDSGPKGGDIQIAHEARKGRCNGIIFFMDPLSAQPHIEDIYALTEISAAYCPMGTDATRGESVLDQVTEALG